MVQMKVTPGNTFKRPRLKISLLGNSLGYCLVAISSTCPYMCPSPIPFFGHGLGNGHVYENPRSQPLTQWHIIFFPYK